MVLRKSPIHAATWVLFWNGQAHDALFLGDFLFPLFYNFALLRSVLIPALLPKGALRFLVVLAVGVEDQLLKALEVEFFEELIERKAPLF